MSGRTPWPEPEFLTLRAAARRAGIGVGQLRRAVRLGDLPVYQLGWPRVRWSEVLRWINAQKVPVMRHARRRLAEVLGRRGGAAR